MQAAVHHDLSVEGHDGAAVVVHQALPAAVRDPAVVA
jgi:hypothetical protein